MAGPPLLRRWGNKVERGARSIGRQAHIIPTFSSVMVQREDIMSSGVI